jgi:hypothetical protein
MTPASSSAEFITGLVQQVPELKPLYQCHLGYYEELIPHAFFGELTRFFAHKCRDEDQHDTATLGRLLTLFERALESQAEEVHELICVSFVENLCDSDHDDVIAKLWKQAGPRLKREFATRGHAV